MRVLPSSKALSLPYSTKFRRYYREAYPWDFYIFGSATPGTRDCEATGTRFAFIHW